MSPRRVVEAAKEARELWDLLWPVILSIFGLASAVVLLLVPGLRDPSMIALVGGALTGGGIALAAKRRSSDGGE